MHELRHARPPEDIGEKYFSDGYCYADLTVPEGQPHAQHYRELISLAKHNRFSTIHNSLERFRDDPVVIGILHQKLFQLITEAPGDYYSIGATFDCCFNAITRRMSREQAHEALVATSNIANVNLFFDVWAVLQRYPSEPIAEVITVVSRFHDGIPMHECEEVTRRTRSSYFHAHQYDAIKAIVFRNERVDFELASIVGGDLAKFIAAAEMQIAKAEECTMKYKEIERAITGMLGEHTAAPITTFLAEMSHPYWKKSGDPFEQLMEDYVINNGPLYQILERLTGAEKSTNILQSVIEKSFKKGPSCLSGVIEFIYHRSNARVEKLEEAIATMNEMLS